MRVFANKTIRIEKNKNKNYKDFIFTNFFFFYSTQNNLKHFSKLYLKT